MFDRQSLHIAMLLWGFVFCLIAALCIFMSTNFDKKKRHWMLLMQIFCASLLLFDALAWGFRGSSTVLAYGMVRISNFFVFCISDILLYLYQGYMCCCIFDKNYGIWQTLTGFLTKKDKKGEAEKIVRRQKVIPVKRIFAVEVISLAGVVAVIISQFNKMYYWIDANNLYHRNYAYIISVLIPLTGMLIDLSILFQERRKISKELFLSMVSYIALPLLATIVQVFYYGVSLTNIAISISMILMFVVAIIDQNQILAKKEKEAADLRITMMLSQIAPHFIYNTLTSIKQLCISDPELASEIVDDFSEYLRGNLDSLSQKNLIPFEQELSHVKYYLAIEKVRFKERVNVEYCIMETNFCIPPLTLQPLVENAVKHGLCKKEGGGTVVILTEFRENNIYITIEDDGVGFDPGQVYRDGRNHVGIGNVKSRLEKLCGGTLLIDSQRGKGSKVVIMIPQDKGERRE